MRLKRLYFKKRILVLCAIPFILLLVNICYTLHKNNEIDRNFSKSKKVELYNSIGIEFYNSVGDMSDIDISELRALLPTSDLTEHNYINEVITPVDIMYYKDTLDKQAVYTIPKGTKIVVFRDTFLLKLRDPRDCGYGLNSYPTYNKGWRYVKPFNLYGEDNNEQDFLYVRTKTLMKVVKEVLKVNKGIRGTGWEATLQGATRGYTLGNDKDLYREGVYKSPDLYWDIISGVDILLLSLSLVIFLFSLRKRP